MSIKIFAIFIFIVGVVLRYWMNRRKFNRRNFTGTEEFRNYEHKTSADTFEFILKIVAWGLMLGAIALYFMITFVQKGIS